MDIFGIDFMDTARRNLGKNASESSVIKEAQSLKADKIIALLNKRCNYSLCKHFSSAVYHPR